MCNIVNYVDGDDYRTIFFNVPNANDYDIENLGDALQASAISGGDYIFFSTYIFPQVSYDLGHCRLFCDVLRCSPARLIVDIVPHNLYEHLSFQDLSDSLGFPVYLVIAELRTFLGFIASRPPAVGEGPSAGDYRIILESFDSDFYAVRYGIGNTSRQSVLTRSRRGEPLFLQKDHETKFEKLRQSEKRAFGDTMTAELLNDILGYEVLSRQQMELV